MMTGGNLTHPGNFWKFKTRKFENMAMCKVNQPSKYIPSRRRSFYGEGEDVLTGKDSIYVFGNEFRQT